VLCFLNKDLQGVIPHEDDPCGDFGGDDKSQHSLGTGRSREFRSFGK